MLILLPYTTEVPSTLNGYFSSGIIFTVAARFAFTLPLKKILFGVILANLSTTPNTVR
jgi:hypothetical protein